MKKMSNKVGVSLNVGADCLVYLENLTAVVERLEVLSGTIAGKALKPNRAATSVDEQDSGDEEPVKETKSAVKKSKMQPRVTEETFDLGEDDEDKAEMAEEVTIKDVIAACRANREVAVKVLKRLKVASVHELKPAQYSKVLAEIGA
jgi:hypothetical protein